MRKKITKVVLQVKPLNDKQNMCVGWQAVDRDTGKQVYAYYKRNCTSLEPQVSLKLRTHVEQYAVTRRVDGENAYSLVKYTNVGV